jgi:hypothetical protein
MSYILSRLFFITLFLAFYPFILLWMVYGAHLEYMRDNPWNPPDYTFFKVVIGVLGPFGFCIWFAAVTRWLEMGRNERTGRDDDGTNVRSCLGWLGSLLGGFLSLPYCGYHDIYGEASVYLMALGNISPAIIYVFWRMLRNAFTQDSD